MRNTRTSLAAAAVAFASTLPARAQQQVQGFAAERLQLSAPGSAWLAFDDLRSHEGLGGAVSLSFGYAHRPLVIEAPNAGPGLAVVQHQAFADIGLAVSYDRFQVCTHFSSPLYVSGKGGAVGGFQFAGASATIEQDPDTIADVPVGLVARIFGDSTGPSRVGVGALFIFPSGSRAGYLTDDTFRMMARALFAGDAGSVSYAAHLGVHVRPLDGSPAPGTPRGSELLFGASVGMRRAMAGGSLLIGPEIFGASAFRSLFGSETTALEALLTGRIEPGGAATGRVGIKIGIGAGVHPRFGSPEWRAVVGIDLRGQALSGGDRGATSW